MHVSWNTKYYLQKAHKLGRKINYYRGNSSSKGHAAGSHRRPHGVDFAVFSLCVAAAEPTTTALRWVRSLSEAGVFVRRTDPGDARRAFITLSDQAHEAMIGWLRRFATVFALR